MSFKIPYTLIRSRRRTIGLSITSDAKLVVRAPRSTSREHIERLINEKADWILRAMARVQHRLEAKPYLSHARLTPGEIAQYKREARRVIPTRVAFYAQRFGIAVGKVKITSATKRWGSCSPPGKNGTPANLNFSWRLARAPLAAIDYVVVHELAHVAHRNHSHAFWASVQAMYPEYEAAKRLLS